MDPTSPGWYMNPANPISPMNPINPSSPIYIASQSSAQSGGASCSPDAACWAALGVIGLIFLMITIGFCALAVWYLK